MARWSLYGVRVDGQDKLTLRKYISSPSTMGTLLLRQTDNLLSDWGLEGLLSKSRALRMFEPEWHRRDWIGHWGLRNFLEMGEMPDDSLAIRRFMACDWAYIINLDDLVFEVYRDFQTEPHNRGRYAHLRPDSRGEFYPVALVKDWPLDALPRPEGFLRELIAIDPQAAMAE